MMETTSEEPAWKKTTLSLERPYKYDDGRPIPALFDITPEGEYIYEPEETPAKRLGENLRRIFIERGVDFFDRNDGHILEGDQLLVGNIDDKDAEPENDEEETGFRPGNASDKPMTSDELHKLRMDVIPHLFVALGEMSTARDLLSTLLSSDTPTLQAMLQGTQKPQQPPSQTNKLLSATIVTKPNPIISVEAFNAQLTIGGKDEALRKAADVFKVAADSMERARVRNDKYWLDALKIRRANWGLIPAPLPFGSATGKGADKTSKDFLVSYGLEESPAVFRRRAIGIMGSYENSSTDKLVLPSRQNTHLCVSIRLTNGSFAGTKARNVVNQVDVSTLDGALKAAQQEIVEREIFAALVQEAGTLPTASARVSERLIVIDAAQDIELIFEQTESESLQATDVPCDSILQAKCNLIYSSLHGLLLRLHSHLKDLRLGHADTTARPKILQPIIDLLQYEVFCRRVKSELDGITTALKASGVPASLRFVLVGEIGQELIRFLGTDMKERKIGGEAVLRIGESRTIRLTLQSPSSLTAHLPQATISILSIPQFYQLLTDETERFLLQQICDLGKRLCAAVGGIWFLDFNRAVGRWDGCVLDFRISFTDDCAIKCTSFRLDKRISKHGETHVYIPPESVSLLMWVERLVQSVLSS